MSKRRVSRFTTCKSLNLPLHLSCSFCSKDSCSRCLKPFTKKNSQSRHLHKRKLYIDIKDYFDTLDENGHQDSMLLNRQNKNGHSNDSSFIVPIERRSDVSHGFQEQYVGNIDNINQIEASAVNTLSTFFASPSIPMPSTPSNERNSTLMVSPHENTSPAPFEEEEPSILQQESTPPGSNINTSSSNIKFNKYCGSSRNENFQINIPSTHSIVTKRELGVLKAKSQKFDSLMKVVQSGRYTRTATGSSTLAFGVTLVPSCSYFGLSTLLPFAVGSVFEDAGIELDKSRLIESLPSSQTLRTLVTETAVDTVLLTRQSLQLNPHVYITCDKGNKKGNKNLAKVICWFDNLKKKVQTFLVDIDQSDENTSEVCDGLMHSLTRLFGNDTVITIRGQCTDSGGGGTKNALKLAIFQQQSHHPAIHIERQLYVVGTCTLHNLQTAFKNAIVKVIGEGKLNDKNLSQMLHGAYNIQNYHEKDELCEMWIFVQMNGDAGLKFRTLQEPIVTRWWYFGMCACSFKKDFKIWKRLLKGIAKNSPRSSASWQVADATLQLMNNKQILNDLDLVVAFHECFLFPHFKFFQGGDPRTGNTPGFLARHVLVRYFLMIRDLESLEDGKWRENEKFQDYSRSYDNLNNRMKRRQNLKLTEFISTVKKSIKKHFNCWLMKDLFFLSVFSDRQTAQCVARMIKGYRISYTEADTYFCEYHNRRISMKQFFEFLKKGVTPNENSDDDDILLHSRDVPIIKNFDVAVMLIANGCDVWSDQDISAELTNFRDAFLKLYSAFATNTHSAERAIKESGEVTLAPRTEEFRTILAIARGRMIQDALRCGIVALKKLDEQGHFGENGAKEHQLKGKRRTHFLMQELQKQFVNLKNYKDGMPVEEYERRRKAVKRSLTKNTFRTRRVRLKVEKLKESVGEADISGTDEENEEETMTPFMMGRIRYFDILMKDNILTVRRELQARNIAFDGPPKWKPMIRLLKAHERDSKTFMPVLPYEDYILRDSS